MFRLKFFFLESESCEELKKQILDNYGPEDIKQRIEFDETLNYTLLKERIKVFPEKFVEWQMEILKALMYQPYIIDHEARIVTKMSAVINRIGKVALYLSEAESQNNSNKRIYDMVFDYLNAIQQMVLAEEIECIALSLEQIRSEHITCEVGFDVFAVHLKNEYLSLVDGLYYPYYDEFFIGKRKEPIEIKYNFYVFVAYCVIKDSLEKSIIPKLIVELVNVGGAVDHIDFDVYKIDDSKKEILRMVSAKINLIGQKPKEGTVIEYLKSKKGNTSRFGFYISKEGAWDQKKLAVLEELTDTLSVTTGFTDFKTLFQSFKSDPKRFMGS